jgi:hypothetical protein
MSMSRERFPNTSSSTPWTALCGGNQTADAGVIEIEVDKMLIFVPSRLFIGMGRVSEIAFRTKGIPPLFTHWWHFVRSGSGDLWGIVLGLPDTQGVWRTCPVPLEKAK